jgi:hypothetical protein
MHGGADFGHLECFTAYAGKGIWYIHPVQDVGGRLSFRACCPKDDLEEKENCFRYSGNGSPKKRSNCLVKNE